LQGQGLGVKLLATRPWSFTLTLSVWLFGLSLAYWRAGYIDVIHSLLALPGLVALHASVNLVNDYFDAKYGVDRPGVGTVEYRPHPVIHGILGYQGTLAAAGLGAAIAFAAAAFIAASGKPLALPLALAGALLGFLYTAGPVRLKYRGLGEAAVFAAFGPLMVLGVYYVATGSPDTLAAVAGAPLGLIIAAVLLANNVRDAETDRRAGVMTVAARLGWRRAQGLLEAMVAASYLSALLLAALGFIPPASAILALISLPAALGALREARRHGPPADYDPRMAKAATFYGILMAVGAGASAVLQL